MRVHAWVYTRIAVPRAGSNNTPQQGAPPAARARSLPPGPAPRQLILRRRVYGAQGSHGAGQEQTNSNSNDEQPRRRDRVKAAPEPTKELPVAQAGAL